MAAHSDRYTALTWRKSSASGNTGDCVEVSQSGSDVLVRDSGDASGVVLVLTSMQWRDLLQRIRGGEPHLPDGG
jgi:hypothetical protein